MDKIHGSRRALLSGITAGAALGVLPGWRHAFAQGSGPIKVGLIVPLTGAAGAYGPAMAKAGRLTAEYINKEAGGVLGGRPIHVVVEDSESNATAGVAVARKLIDVEKVVAIAGVWNSPVAMSVKPITLERNLVLLVSGSADQITEGDNKGLVWRFQARGRDWGTVIARAMLKDGVRKASMLGLQNPFTSGMVDPFVAEMKNGGAEVLDVTYYNPNQPSYRAEVEKVFGRKPEGVFMPALLPDFTAIAKEVYRAGFSSKMYTLSIAGDSEGRFVKNVGTEVAEGINHLQPIPPLNSPAYRKFLNLMGEPEGKLFLFACNTYDQIAMLAMAMERARSASSPEFAKQLMSIANGPGQVVDNPIEGLKLIRAGKPVNYTGAGSVVEFKPNGDLANRDFGHYVIRSGKNQLVKVIS